MKRVSRPAPPGRTHRHTRIGASGPEGTPRGPDAAGTDTLHRFVNVYVNDEDVRFTGGLATVVDDGDGDHPARGRGRLINGGTLRPLIESVGYTH